MPFEVPQGWGWTTVAEISKSILYGVNESAKTSGAYKLLRITDIQENNVDWDTVPFTDYDESKVGVYLLEENDILFARTGATVGKSYLVKGLCESSIYASYLIRVQTFKEILPQYVKYFFESGFYWEQIERSSVGIGQPNVNGTTLGNLRLPIPPINEQERIVSELKKWIAVITSIEANKNDLQGYIESAKSKILDLAIHGKLVPQDPNDEPAVDLLRRINPKFTPCDNGHYTQLPEGWSICKLSKLCKIENGFAFSSNDYRSEGTPLIRISNIVNNSIDLTDCVYIQNNAEYRFVVNKGDLLIAMSGATTGKMGVYSFERTAFLNQRVGNIKILDGSLLSADYRNVYMQSKVDDILKFAYGGAQPNISASVIGDFDILLPPLEEQKRIVCTVNKVFTKLDTIMESL